MEFDPRVRVLLLACVKQVRANEAIPYYKKSIQEIE